MKNKTVALVNEWALFEEQHPNAEIADFCRFYLSRQDHLLPNKDLVGGVIPPFNDGLMMKIIGRIGKLNMYYSNLALKDTPLNQIDEFGLLVTIRQEKNPKKTEAIYSNLFELSSGTDILNRMLKKGLIREEIDEEDKRAKRISLTEKGEEAYQLCLQRVTKNATMMTSQLGQDEKKLIIHLLKDIEIKFSALWQKSRGLDFDTVFEHVVENRSVDE